MAISEIPKSLSQVYRYDVVYPQIWDSTDHLGSICSKIMSKLGMISLVFWSLNSVGIPRVSLLAMVNSNYFFGIDNSNCKRDVGYVRMVVKSNKGIVFKRKNYD